MSTGTEETRPPSLPVECGAEVPATYDFLLYTVRYLNVKICDVETCYLDVRTHGADRRVKDEFKPLRGSNINFIKKRIK